MEFVFVEKDENYIQVIKQIIKKHLFIFEKNIRIKEFKNCNKRLEIELQNNHKKTVYIIGTHFKNNKEKIKFIDSNKNSEPKAKIIKKSGYVKYQNKITISDNKNMLNYSSGNSYLNLQRQ